MTKQENMTREQAEEELRQLRKVFRSVRLLTQENVCSPGGRRPCYAQWKRTRPCENCVARRALEEKGRKSKLEYLDKELYQVTASYIQGGRQTLCAGNDPENGPQPDAGP